MKTILRITILLSLLAYIGFSCKKNGTGGKALIHAEIFHHSTPIKGSVVYVKFNAKDAPSAPESNYDLKVVGEATENHVHIENLRQGNYYLYAVGYDSTLNTIVKGGVAVAISWQNRNKVVSTSIAVSE